LFFRFAVEIEVENRGPPRHRSCASTTTGDSKIRPQGEVVPLLGAGVPYEVWSEPHSQEILDLSWVEVLTPIPSSM
jgi:hypothetical protein